MASRSRLLAMTVPIALSIATTTADVAIGAGGAGVASALSGCESRLDLGHDHDASALEENADGGDGNGNGNGNGNGDGDGDGDDSSDDAGFGANPCEAACSTLLRCGFYDAGAAERCITECSALSTTIRDCIRNAECLNVPACYFTGGDGSAGDPFTAPCQARCDDAHFFSCLDANELESCRKLCASKPDDDRRTFTTCSTNAAAQCDDERDCYSVFSR